MLTREKFSSSSLRTKGFLILFTLLMASPIMVAQDQKTGPTIKSNNPLEIQPQGSNPDWAPNIDPQMLAVIEQFSSF